MIEFSFNSTSLHTFTAMFFRGIQLFKRFFLTKTLDIYKSHGAKRVKASASRAAHPRFDYCLRRDFSGSSHTSDLKKKKKLALQWLPCQAPGVVGSVLGQVVPVLVHSDWVR